MKDVLHIVAFLSTSEWFWLGGVAVAVVFVVGSLARFIYGEYEYRRFLKKNNGTDEGIDD